ncbi:uncharacterized protein LOC116602321 [Nematostella vectensis]|nr:uncharacterized protein LOC116602321 [Nematostella vectensis]XP_032219611.1 uncharacterized protein LOC116602321 [Nematostella vectensis]
MGTQSAWRSHIISQSQRHCGFIVLLCTILYVYIVYSYVSHQAKTASEFPRYPIFPFAVEELSLFADFMTSWCAQTRAKIDWIRAQEPCVNEMAWRPGWNSLTQRNRTDVKKSYLALYDLRPAGEFSRLAIQTVDIDGVRKLFGGDSWRVNIRGPSSVSPLVLDHLNGTYEILFLVKLPGIYTVQAVLEYTLCDGYKDPPIDWFIKGNAQGKYQPLDALPGYEKPFLLLPLWGSKPFKIKIPPVGRGKPLIDKLGYHFQFLNHVCSIKCRFLWEGEGAWMRLKWQPYTNGVLERQRQDFDASKGTLWIYGDSVGDFFHRSILRHPLCTKLFKHCNRTYNWVYNLPGANQTIGKILNDNLDFSIDRILHEISLVLNSTQMRDNPHSVLVLNLGLHYVQNINFTKYQEMIDRVIGLLRGEETGEVGEVGRGFRGQVVWKTTTAINRERYGDPRKGAIHAKVIRFLTYQRVLLYNAYATNAMCNAGIDILDVFPMSNAHPNGTGLPHKRFDAVHYPAGTFTRASDVLYKYFS